jgi:hypothetical protein
MQSKNVIVEKLEYFEEIKSDLGKQEILHPKITGWIECLKWVLGEP